MRALSAIVVSIVVVITGCARSFAMPSAEELQDPIERYLVNQQACSGTVKVERLRIDRVGDYDRALGGWPVYAVFEVSCRQSGYTETWTGGDSDEVITAMVRKAPEGYVAFMPRVFQEGLDALTN